MMEDSNLSHYDDLFNDACQALARQARREQLGLRLEFWLRENFTVCAI